MYLKNNNHHILPLKMSWKKKTISGVGVLLRSTEGVLVIGGGGQHSSEGVGLPIGLNSMTAFVAEKMGNS